MPVRVMGARGLLAALVLAVLGVSTVPASAEVDEWFTAEIPKAEAVTEERFATQDPRYLHLLRTLAVAITRLGDGSVTFQTGSRHHTLYTAGQYREMMETYRKMQEEDPDADWSYLPDFEATGIPETPYRDGWESSETYRRLFAGETQLRTESEHAWSRSDSSSSKSVTQRAWNGTQSWWRSSDDDDPHAAQLGPARSPGETDEDEDGWSDILLLAKALATLIDAGTPSRITQQVDGADVLLHMTWSGSGGAALRVVVDEGHGYTPIEWSHVTQHNRLQEFLNRYEEFGGLDAYLEQSYGEEAAEMREHYEEELARLQEDPMETQEHRLVFHPWKRDGGGRWLPTRIEQIKAPPVTEQDKTDETASAMPLRETIEWVEWTNVRGRVTPREAFLPPLEYEGYAGQQWIDMSAPHDEKGREKVAERLRAGLVLTAGEDMYGKGRWVVSDADDAVLGQWPIQAGDVFMLAGCTCLEPLEIEPDAEGRGPIDKIAQAIQDAKHDDPATLRVARGDRIIDMVCWVPASDRPEDLAAMQEQMLKSHEYPPLPHADAVAFAEAVLAATDDLVRGTGE